MAHATHFKAVTGRSNSYRELVADVQGLSGKIRQAFDAEHGEGVGESFERVLGAAMATLEKRHGELVEAESCLSVEKREAIQATAERCRLVGECRRILAPLRDTLTAFFGKELAVSVGLTGAIPESAFDVANLASYVLLRIEKAPSPKNRMVDSSITPRELAAALVEPSAKLNALLQWVADEREQRRSARFAKDEAIERYDRAFAVAANLLSTGVDAMGDHEAARDLRPSTRFPGRTVKAARIAQNRRRRGEKKPAEPGEAKSAAATGG